MVKKVLLNLTLLLAAFFLFTNIALATDAGGTGATTPNAGGTGAGCPSGQVCLGDPLGLSNNPAPIPTLLGNIIKAILGIVGSLALVMFIYGGITWMLSAGNQEQVTKGKNIIIWATLGLVIIFTAYALVKFVLTTITT